VEEGSFLVQPENVVDCVIHEKKAQRSAGLPFHAGGGARNELDVGTNKSQTHAAADHLDFYRQ
jgi:hypothetical protein